ncbi:MAG: hypothetical protein ACKVQS_00440 [Fimbriimonadaceae bacterium]
MNFDHDPDMRRCGKCGAQMRTPDWCGSCASKRQLWLALLFFIAGPAVGFGTCVLGIGTGSANNQAGTVLIWLGLILLVLGPMVGFVMFILSLVSSRK